MNVDKRLLDMMNYPARQIEFKDYNKEEVLKCPVCGWVGTPEGNVEFYSDLLDVSCPVCEKMLLIVSYPLVEYKKIPLLAPEKCMLWNKPESIRKWFNNSEFEVLEDFGEIDGFENESSKILLKCRECSQLYMNVNINYIDEEHISGTDDFMAAMLLPVETIDQAKSISSGWLCKLQTYSPQLAFYVNDHGRDVSIKWT